jgi:hypothetical protein
MGFAIWLPIPTRSCNSGKILVTIKLLHTAAWLFFAGCIVAIPVAASMRRLQTACILIGFVLVECLILAFNRGRCPSTSWAARYTRDRSPNFDIYLPAWLARWNKEIFGTLFAFGILWVLIVWLWL